MPIDKTSMLWPIKSGLVRTWSELKFQLRLANAAERTLPQFLIIGSQKGGTTSLYAYLCQHPDIKAAFNKEIHYFDYGFVQGEQWYRAHFPKHKALDPDSQKGPRTITGEATPCYMQHPFAARRIRELLPDVKLIAILRNPIDRAFSHYKMMSVRKDFERLSFEEAIEAEPDRLAADLAELQRNEFARAEFHQRASYISRGFYYEQLLQFDDYYKSGQLLVLSSEDLFANPQAAFDQTLEYLGLRPFNLQDCTPQNQGQGAYYADQIKTETLQKLTELYNSHNEKLYDYIGRDMNW